MDSYTWRRCYFLGFQETTCKTDSIIAAEFIALPLASKETEWLQNLLCEIPLWLKPIAQVFIHYDSAATLVKACSQVYNETFRHIEYRHSYVKDLILDGLITIDFVRSSQNLANPLTKRLAKDLVNET